MSPTYVTHGGPIEEHWQSIEYGSKESLATLLPLSMTLKKFIYGLQNALGIVTQLHLDSFYVFYCMKTLLRKIRWMQIKRRSY